MKLSKLKRLLDDIFEYKTYFVHRKCLIEYIIRDDNSNICGDCEYSCLSRCTTIGLSVVLK